ncbi:hypothetical protein [Sporosarcina sp. Marseille-Q4943]|uniref:hypothetical protein n=1 Tax=Sporosarcina sp. Marseille-Q4943 TaxID=2942204 RepID=UPI00208DBE02|nr:hypothetical protein [Sporosarcina sp. Marseille-Q4943]
MRAEDYKSEDIEDVIELKGMALHQLENIERCLWMDSIDEATLRALNLLEQVWAIRKKKYAKQKEKDFGFLMNKLRAAGVHAEIIKFEHKKTD